MRRFAVLCVFLPSLAVAGIPDLQELVPIPSQLPADPDPVVIENPARKKLKVESENSEKDGDKVKLSGNVKFTYGDYIATCDEAEGDLKTEIFVLKGNVKVVGKDLNYEGEQVSANFKDETFQFKQASSTLRPDLIKGQLLDNLYVTAQGGTGSRKMYELSRGSLTTCDLPGAHYHLKARQMNIFPERRIIMRGAELEILGNRIFKIPYLSIPLDQNSPRYLPEFGQTKDEGYFVKSRFGVGLSGDDLLDVRFEYMTKLGFGLGSDFDYKDPRMEGALKVYSLIGPKPAITSALIHKQEWGRSTITSSWDYSKRNYLTSPENTSFSSRNSILIPNGNANTRIGFNYSSNVATNFSTTNRNWLLNDQRKLGRYALTNDLNFSENSSGSTSFSSERKVVDLRSGISRNLDKVDMDFQYQRSIPVGPVSNFFSATELTPMLTFKTDTGRLSGRKTQKTRIVTQLSIGELIDSIRKKPITRTHLDLSLPTQTIEYGQLGLTATGRFRQGIYSDDTAQFTVGTDLGLAYKFVRDGSLNFRYNYLRAQGYTPLNIDRAGRNDLLGADLSWKFNPRLNLSATSGYDLVTFEREGPNRSPWQTVGIRADWNPADGVGIKTSSSYDTFNKLWSNVRMDINYDKGKQKYIASLRFDGQRHTWGAANFYAEGLTWGRLSTALLLSYNGYTKEFESRQFNFVYDMHCSEAVLTIIENNVGFRSGRQIGFTIRLKALPFSTGFGSGTRGQGFGIGSGNNF